MAKKTETETKTTFRAVVNTPWARVGEEFVASEAAILAYHVRMGHLEVVGTEEVPVEEPKTEEKTDGDGEGTRPAE